MQHLRRTEGGEADKKLKEQLGEEEKPIEGSGHRNRQETEGTMQHSGEVTGKEQRQEGRDRKAREAVGWERGWCEG